VIKRLEKSIHIYLKCLRKLKDYSKLNDPAMPEEEITFLKELNPGSNLS